MKNTIKQRRRLHNRVATGKQPVGLLPKTWKKGFEGFAGFVTKEINN